MVHGTDWSTSLTTQSCSVRAALLVDVLHTIHDLFEQPCSLGDPWLWVKGVRLGTKHLVAATSFLAMFTTHFLDGYDL